MEPDPHAWSVIISSSVVPVVIISACGLLCLAFYNRLAYVVTRLRSLQRERLKEYKELFRLEEEGKNETLRLEMEQLLHSLEGQTAHVLKRAHYIRNCLFCLISSIFSLGVCSFLIGLSLFYPAFDFAVLIFFVFGLFLLLYGLGYALMEIKMALRPIRMETEFVQKLLKSELSSGKRSPNQS